MARTCSDFPDAPSCCDSCHEDADEYGYDLCEVEIGPDEYAVVCCKVSNYLRNLPERTNGLLAPPIDPIV